MKNTHTPPRSVRVPTELWDTSKHKAAKRGETVSDVIIRALRAYNDQPDK